jgi:hypothetical protein
MFHGGIVKENDEFENMNEVVEMFNDRPIIKDLVNSAIQKYGCGVRDVTLRSHFDCEKDRPIMFLCACRARIIETIIRK